MVDTARLNLIVDSSRAKKGVDETERSLTGLQRKVKQTGAAMKGFGNTVQGVFRQLKSFQGAVAGFVAVAVTRNILNTSEAFTTLNRTLELATGSSAQAAEEMEFLRVEADRLGLDLLVVGQEYAKMAVAASTAGVATKDVRDLFLGVAETAKVMGLSTETASGTFLALTQIMSKGKVTAEELRGQLGERLPQAIALMAQTLDVTTGELDKMLQKGEIGIDVLGDFGRTLREASSETLSDSLGTVSSEFARLGNAANEVKVILGESLAPVIASTARGLTGFIKSIPDFVDGVGEAISVVSDFAIVLGSIFIAGKLIAIFQGLTIAIGGLSVATLALQGGTAVILGFAKAMAVLRVAFLAIGGLPAILLGAAAAAVYFSQRETELESAVDDATDAVINHEVALDGLKSSLENIGGLTDKELVQNMAQGAQQLDALASEYNRVQQQLNDATNYEGVTGFVNFLLDDAPWSNGRENIEKLQQRLRELGNQMDQGRVILNKFTGQLRETGGFEFDATPIDTGDIEKFIEKLREQEEQTGLTTLAQKNLAKAVKLDGSAAYLAEVESISKSIEAHKEREKANKQFVTDLKALRDELDPVGMLLREQAQDMDVLNKARERGKISITEFTELEKTLTANYQEEIKEVTGVTEAIEKLTDAREEAQTFRAQIDPQLGFQKQIDEINKLQDVLRETGNLEDISLAGSLEENKRLIEDQIATFGDYAASIDPVLAAEKRRSDELPKLTSLLEDGTISQGAYNNQLKVLADAARDAAIATGQLTEEQLAFEGARSALEEYAESATDNFAQVKDAVSGAFKEGEDAIFNFVKTGKLEFSSLVDSILDDILRMSIKQGITGPLAGALSGAFGGGGTSPGFVGPPAPAGLGNPEGGGFDFTSLIPSVLGLFGGANGLDFTVPGAGGIDSQTVAFKATPGARVVEIPPGGKDQNAGGDRPIVINMNLHGVKDDKTFMRNKPQIVNTLQRDMEQARRNM